MNKREKDLERRRLALLKGLRRGERAVLEGRTLSHEEARARLMSLGRRYQVSVRRRGDGTEHS